MIDYEREFQKKKIEEFFRRPSTLAAIAAFLLLGGTALWSSRFIWREPEPAFTGAFSAYRPTPSDPQAAARPASGPPMRVPPPVTLSARSDQAAADGRLGWRRRWRAWFEGEVPGTPVEMNDEGSTADTAGGAGSGRGALRVFERGSERSSWGGSAVVDGRPAQGEGVASRAVQMAARPQSSGPAPERASRAGARVVGTGSGNRAGRLPGGRLRGVGSAGTGTSAAAGGGTGTSAAFQDTAGSGATAGSAGAIGATGGAPGAGTGVGTGGVALSVTPVSELTPPPPTGPIVQAGPCGCEPAENPGAGCKWYCDESVPAWRRWCLNTSEGYILVGTGGNRPAEIWAYQLDGTPVPLKPPEESGPGFRPYVGTPWDPDAVFHGAAIPGVANLDRWTIPMVVTGAGPGGGPHVRAWDHMGTPWKGLGEGGGFMAYECRWVNPPEDPTEPPEPGDMICFYGGVHIAVRSPTCRRDKKSQAIITGAGPGGGPHVRLFKPDGTPVPGVGGGGGFMAYKATFAGGVNLAVAYLDGCAGGGHIVTGPGAGAMRGGSRVKVFSFDGNTVAPVASTIPFRNFEGGVHVAAGDLDGDGKDEIVMGAGPGGGPHVKVMKLTGKGFRLVGEFFAYDPHFGGGVRVATFVPRDREVARIITGAGPGGGPHVRAFELGHGGEVVPYLPDGRHELSFMAFADPTYTGGVHVEGFSPISADPRPLHAVIGPEEPRQCAAPGASGFPPD